MPWSQERVSSDREQLLRYLDREMSVAEARRFRARLGGSPALRRELSEMRRVGALLRIWAEEAEIHAEPLLEPTLQRVEATVRRRARYASFGYVLAAVMLLALPWSRSREAKPLEPLPSPAAAIERVEAADQQARVFVGSSGTPVVWLADDVQEEEADENGQGPG